MISQGRRGETRSTSRVPVSFSLDREMAEDSRVVVAGFVENIEEEYKSASVFVAPILTGGGVIVKILDALAAGVPVVTTPYGNEGIEAKDGDEISVADSPVKFADKVISLLENRNLRLCMGDKGKNFVSMYFPAEQLKESIEKSLSSLSR